MVVEKACKQCGEVKPLDGFAHSTLNLTQGLMDGKSIYCKRCLVKKTQERRDRDPEAYRASRKRWAATRVSPRCIAEGCVRPSAGRKLCSMHYSRLKRHGDISTCKYLTYGEDRAVVKTADGCTEWQGNRNENGYGVSHYSGKLIYVHRLAWIRERGPIPEGMQVLHECDNPPCCNIDHLFLGTQLDNILDMTQKGRAKRGGKPQLTSDQALDVLGKRVLGISAQAVASEYSLTVNHVYRIWRGRCWANLGERRAV